MAEYLFVYGSLRERAAHPMHRHLREHAQPAGEASISGKLYDLGPYPAALPDDSGRWRVRGELHRLEAPAELLEILDQYEGCRPEDPQPQAYRRVLQAVELAGGKRLQAWVYLYNRAVAAERQIESGDYLDRMRQI